MLPSRNSSSSTCFAVVSIFAVLGLAHCSSSSTSANPDSGAGHTGGSSSGGLGGLGASSGGFGGGSSGSAGPDEDGSPGDVAQVDGASADGGGAVTTGGEGGVPVSSCQAPSGGAACDPGTVVCGATSCATSTHFCCVGGGDGGSDTCTPYNGASCPSGTLTLACDETADCSGGICCEQIVGVGVAGPTQCMTTCPTGWFQICKSNTECGGNSGASGSCIRQTCTLPPGLLGGGASVVVEACAVPPSLGNLNNKGALPGCVAQ